MTAVLTDVLTIVSTWARGFAVTSEHPSAPVPFGAMCLSPFRSSCLGKADPNLRHGCFVRASLFIQLTKRPLNRVSSASSREWSGLTSQVENHGTDRLILDRLATRPWRALHVQPELQYLIAAMPAGDDLVVTAIISATFFWLCTGQSATVS